VSTRSAATSASPVSHTPFPHTATLLMGSTLAMLRQPAPGTVREPLLTAWSRSDIPSAENGTEGREPAARGKGGSRCKEGECYRACDQKETNAG
jgi:hypothetical protein